MVCTLSIPRPIPLQYQYLISTHYKLGKSERAVSGLVDRIDPGSNILMFLRDLCKNGVFYCYGWWGLAP